MTSAEREAEIKRIDALRDEEWDRLDKLGIYTADEINRIVAQKYPYPS